MDVTVNRAIELVKNLRKGADFIESLIMENSEDLNISVIMAVCDESQGRVMATLQGSGKDLIGNLIGLFGDEIDGDWILKEAARLIPIVKIKAEKYE